MLYNFNADHPSEMSVKAGQVIKIAPKEIQQMNRLLSTNWLLATTDGAHVGLVPVNYIKRHEVFPMNPTQDPNPIQISQQQEQPVNPQADSPTSTENDTIKSEINKDENVS